MKTIFRATFGIHVDFGDDCPDSFYLGSDEEMWAWIISPVALDNPESVIKDNGFRSLFADIENNSVFDWFMDPQYSSPVVATKLLEVELPAGYFYWNGNVFHASNELPHGLVNLSAARRTVTVTADFVLDDKAYIATMGLVEVTPKEFYNAELLPGRIISAKG